MNLNILAVDGYALALGGCAKAEVIAGIEEGDVLTGGGYRRKPIRGGHIACRRLGQRAEDRDIKVLAGGNAVKDKTSRTGIVDLDCVSGRLKRAQHVPALVEGYVLVRRRGNGYLAVLVQHDLLRCGLSNSTGSGHGQVVGRNLAEGDSIHVVHRDVSGLGGDFAEVVGGVVKRDVLRRSPVLCGDVGKAAHDNLLGRSAAVLRHGALRRQLEGASRDFAEDEPVGGVDVVDSHLAAADSELLEAVETVELDELAGPRGDVGRASGGNRDLLGAGGLGHFVSRDNREVVRRDVVEGQVVVGGVLVRYGHVGAIGLDRRELVVGVGDEDVVAGRALGLEVGRSGNDDLLVRNLRNGAVLRGDDQVLCGDVVEGNGVLVDESDLRI